MILAAVGAMIVAVLAVRLAGVDLSVLPPDLTPIPVPFKIAAGKHKGSSTHHIRLQGELLARVSRWVVMGVVLLLLMLLFLPVLLFLFFVFVAVVVDVVHAAVAVAVYLGCALLSAAADSLRQ